MHQNTHQTMPGAEAPGLSLTPARERLTRKSRDLLLARQEIPGAFGNKIRERWQGESSLGNAHLAKPREDAQMLMNMVRGQNSKAYFCNLSMRLPTAEEAGAEER